MTLNGASSRGAGGEGRMWTEGEPSDVFAGEPPRGVDEPLERGFPLQLRCSDSDTSLGLGLRTMIVVACCCLGKSPTTSDDLGHPCSDS
jgi:hypothetical protein